MRKFLVPAFILAGAFSICAQISNSEADEKWRTEATKRNGAPEPINYPTTRANSDRVLVEKVKRAIITPPRTVSKPTKQDKEEAEKEYKDYVKARSSRYEDVISNAEFLKEKNTGIFRLHPDLGCVSGEIKSSFSALSEKTTTAALRFCGKSYQTKKFPL